jgi:hypothetical protein
MNEYLQTAITYAEFAATAAVWIGLCCLIVAGLERVVFSIIPRRPPEKFIAPAIELEAPPQAQ